MTSNASSSALVRINYSVRAAAFAYSFLVIGLHGWDHGLGPVFFVALGMQFLIYPHLLYLRASRASDPRRAEEQNLYLDAALLGGWSAALGFPVWIVYGLLFSTALNATTVRGAGGALASIGCFGVGAALWVSAGGLNYWPATSGLVTALCFFGALAYSCAIGYVLQWQTQRLASARDDLKKSEERYKMIAENAGDLIAMVDEEGRWLYASPSYVRVLEGAHLAPNTDAFRRLHPDDAERTRMALRRAISTGKPRELALRLLDRVGRIRQYKTRLQPLEKNCLLVSQDVTDLRDSEERLLLTAHALEGMTEAILITGSDGTVLTVNRAFCDITGYSREEVLGTPERLIRNALQPPEFYAELYATVARDGYWSGTTWSRRKNGSVYREWRSIRGIRDENGSLTHFVAVFYEVGAPRAVDTPDQKSSSS